MDNPLTWTPEPVKHPASSDNESLLLVACVRAGGAVQFVRDLTRYYYAEGPKTVDEIVRDVEYHKTTGGRGWLTSDLNEADLFDGRRDHALREVCERCFTVSWMPVSLGLAPASLPPEGVPPSISG